MNSDDPSWRDDINSTWLRSSWWHLDTSIHRRSIVPITCNQRKHRLFSNLRWKPHVRISFRHYITFMRALHIPLSPVVNRVVNSSRSSDYSHKIILSECGIVYQKAWYVINPSSHGAMNCKPARCIINEYFSARIIYTTNSINPNNSPPVN